MAAEVKDRKLLELAAKAAGKCANVWAAPGEINEKGGFVQLVRRGLVETWDPRDDNADSFELAATLRISVEHNHPADNRPWVSASVDAIAGNRARMFMEDVPDESQRAEAMRLAIVRCAAAQASGETA